MNNKAINQEKHLRDIIEPYLRRWKFIIFCLLAAIFLAVLYLRYTNYEYKATATIKIKDDKDNNKLPEISAMQNYGLFKTDLNNVLDEIEVIKSRSLITSVVKELKYNIQFFVEGRIQASEVYKNPPLSINFSASDSILHKIDTTFNIRINSATDFLLKGISKKNKLSLNKSNYGDINEEGVLYNFGESVTTGFGDIIITPRIGQYAAKIGSNIRISISPLIGIAGSYKKKLVITTKEGSSVIKLSINDNVNEKAQLFLDKLIEKYNEDVINDKLLVIETTSDFINNRLDIVSTELGQVDLSAESLQQDNRLTDLATQSSIVLQTERENESKLIATANQIQLIDYMSQHLSDNNNSSDLIPANIGISDVSVAQVTKRHNELVLERSRVLKNSSEKNPTVINLSNQIDELKYNIDQSLKSIKSSNEITYNTLKNENLKISSRIYTAPKKERQFRDIKRQQDIKEALYLYLLQKREESAISLGVTSPNAKIIDKAFASSAPVTPKKTVIILTALIFGFSLPIGFIYLLTLFDSKIHNTNDIKRVLDVPISGEIPKSSKRKRLISKVDYSPKAEAFRMVRTNLDFMLQNINGRAKTIFVTSTTSKEGKSHTSINLALSLSFSEKKVLLIETDIRVPKATHYLDVKNEIGLTNFIGNSNLNISDVIAKLDNNDYLDVIPSGVIPPNPAELLMSERVQFLFDEVKHSYDYIIVDTAAVGLVTDTLLISKHADMFIYVVRANYIDKRRLQVAKAMYSEKRLPNMSILVNDVKHKRGYGYGYGYGKNPMKKKWWKFS